VGAIIETYQRVG